MSQRDDLVRQVSGMSEAKKRALLRVLLDQLFGSAAASETVCDEHENILYYIRSGGPAVERVRSVNLREDELVALGFSPDQFEHVKE